MERVRRTNFARLMNEQHPYWHSYEWAGYLGADPKVLRGYARGTRDWSLRHLHRFAEMMEVDPADLLGWDDDEYWADPFERLLKRAERHAVQE
jgi:hypothetical protein